MAKSKQAPKWTKSKKPVVAVWVGKFKHEDDLMTYARWNLTEELGLPKGQFFDRDNTLRYRLEKKGGGIDGMISNLEYAASFAKPLKQQIKEMKPKAFNAVIAVYGYSTQDTLDRLTKRAQFVGFFEVDPKAGRIGKGPIWSEKDKKMAIWIGRFEDQKQLKTYAEDQFFDEVNFPPEYTFRSNSAYAFAKKSKGLLGALAYYLDSASYMPAVVTELTVEDLQCNAAILIRRFIPDQDVSKLASKARFLGYFNYSNAAGEYDIKKAKLPSQTTEPVLEVSLLDRCGAHLGLKKTPNADDLQGFLGQFRPNGKGLDALFAGVPAGPETVKRIKAVMKVDGSDQGLSLSVNKPLAPAADKAESLVKQFFGKANQFARELEDEEVEEMFPKSPKIVIKKGARKKYRDNKRTQQAIEYYLEMVEGAMDDIDSPTADLHEAIYTLVYDFGLTYYILWPGYADDVGTKDPFRPHFELWRRDIRWRLISAETVEVFLP